MTAIATPPATAPRSTSGHKRTAACLCAEGQSRPPAGDALHRRRPCAHDAEARQTVRGHVQRAARTHRHLGGRYKTCLVDSDRYVLTCECYIELNAVRARMTDDPAAAPLTCFHTSLLARRRGLLNPLTEQHRTRERPPAAAHRMARPIEPPSAGGAGGSCAAFPSTVSDASPRPYTPPSLTAVAGRRARIDRQRAYCAAFPGSASSTPSSQKRNQSRLRW